MLTPEVRAAAPLRYREVQAAAHPHCVVCGYGHLTFDLHDDGVVEGRFTEGDGYQGYSGIVHGGVVATLLDAAMTHCLFALERRALTAELRVRYRRPVLSAGECLVRAHLQRRRRSWFEVRADLIQDGQVKASAVGKFIEASEQ